MHFGESSLSSTPSRTRTSPRQADAWPLPPPGDGYLHVRINRNTLIAVLVSLLVHALLLFFLPNLLPLTPPARAPQQDLVVRLNTVKLPPAPKPEPEVKTPPAAGAVPVRWRSRAVFWAEACARAVAGVLAWVWVQVSARAPAAFAPRVRVWAPAAAASPY